MCYIYIIEAQTSKNIKIGISDEPRNRLAELQVGNYEELRINYTIKCHDRQQARRLEAHLHKKYAEKRIRLEWFSVPAREVYEYVLELQLVWTAVVFPLPTIDDSPPDFGFTSATPAAPEPIDIKSPLTAEDIKTVLLLGLIFFGSLSMAVFGLMFHDSLAVWLGIISGSLSLVFFAMSLFFAVQKQLSVPK